LYLLVISLPIVHFLCFLKVEMYQGLKWPPFCLEKNVLLLPNKIKRKIN
jgi:hypothetical protein